MGAEPVSLNPIKRFFVLLIVLPERANFVDASRVPKSSPLASPDVYRVVATSFLASSPTWKNMLSS